MTEDADDTVVKTNTEISLTKVVIQEGKELARPDEGSVCTVVCKLLSRHDDISEKEVGMALDKETEIRLGYFTTEIGRHLHAAVEAMRLGEISEISFELNQKLIRPDVSNIKTFVFIDLKFKIELVAFDNSASIHKVYDLKVEDFMLLANQHKNDANEIFKANLVLTAFYRYQRAMKYLIIAQQLNKSEKDHEEAADDANLANKAKILELKAILYLNIAACQLKYPNNSEHVIKNCTKCLEIHHDNVKALYRRALAYADNHDFDNAISDLKHALKIEASNKAVEEKLRSIEIFKHKENEKMSRNLKKMFE